MHASAIEASAQARHTARHLLLKVILIVSTLMGMLGMNATQAVGEVSKHNYDYSAAELSCKRYDNQGTYYTEAYTLNPTTLVIAIPYGPAAYVNQCQANICNWTRQGNVDYSWLTPPACIVIPSSGNPSSQPVCPLKARLATQVAWGWYPPATFADTPCVCEAGYVSDQAGAACVQCLAPQRIDTVTGRCITDTYEIKLIGGTQTEPSQSLNFVATVVNTITQKPPTIPVTIKVRLSVEDTSGGHDHGTDTRPRGSLNSTACATDDTCLEGPADGNGALSFNFKPTDASGIHTITASCDKCSGEDSKTVNVKVDGLIEIPSSQFYVFGSSSRHGTKNHYLMPAAAEKLLLLAINYQSQSRFKVMNPNTNTMVWPEPIRVNDASLEWGGRFDIYGDWKNPHSEHTRGVSVDLRANEGTPNAIPPENFTKFEMLLDSVIPKGKVKKYILECTGDEEDGPQHDRVSENNCVSVLDGSFDNNRHYHIRLMGVK